MALRVSMIMDGHDVEAWANARIAYLTADTDVERVGFAEGLGVVVVPGQTDPSGNRCCYLTKYQRNKAIAELRYAEKYARLARLGSALAVLDALCNCSDAEVAHRDADNALLALINDPKVTVAFNKVARDEREGKS